MAFALAASAYRSPIPLVCVLPARRLFRQPVLLVATSRTVCVEIVVRLRCKLHQVRDGDDQIRCPLFSLDMRQCNILV
jgi:hypothetical protein